MRYRFDDFELDTGQFVLRHHGVDVHVEPLVFDLLRFLIERVGQVLSRDAVIEQVWKGRIVSDATVSSCIKSARRALGDSGEQQTYIRTVRGRGFQLVATVEAIAPPEQGGIVTVAPAAPGSAGLAQAAGSIEPPKESAPPLAPPAAPNLPPRIAVLPLFPLSADPQLAIVGDALAQEVILELARLHWLFVIARGSSFKFRGQEVDLGQAGAVLGADYFLTGTILQEGGDCIISVELCHGAASHVLWAERYVTPVDGLMHMRSRLAGEIIGALEPRIQLHEAVQAARVPTENLTAWSAYHRGLWHMYRFNRTDNETAAHLFAHATRLDPGFARAHAGLSFTHFQSAFLGFSSDVAGEKRLMRRLAEKSIELDPLDPFANLTMGRTEWLEGSLETSMPWLERAVALSPNYAFAIYNSALVGTMIGDGAGNERKVARAIELSPIDPLSYAMLATRALTHAIRGNHAVAAQWAERAVRSPNAHVQIHTIAALTHELSGCREAADRYVAQIRRMHPGYGRSDFARSFPFRDAAVLREVEASLVRLGL